MKKIEVAVANSFDARICGPNAWKKWLRITGSLLRRCPVGLWIGLLLVVVAIEALFSFVPWVAMGVIAGLTLASRPSFGALAEALLAGSSLSFREAWGAGCNAWQPRSTVLLLVSVLAGGLVGGVFPEAHDMVALPSTGWLLAGWCFLCLRPWGPIGFITELIQAGAPPLLAFSLQSRAVLLNLSSFLWIAALWFLLIPVMLGLNQAVMAGVLVLFAPATLAWLLLVRCIYLDVFGSGLTLVERAPVATQASRAVLG